VLFTGLFDTGKQGKEWPGTFEIAQKEGYFWHAAKSVPHPTQKQTSWIQLDLRGERPVGDATHLFFRYMLEGADAIRIALGSAPKPPAQPAFIELKGLKKGAWAETTVDLDVLAPGQLAKGSALRAIAFHVAATATLWIDDLLLYEPGRK
jgi:hypothetical protein